VLRPDCGCPSLPSSGGVVVEGSSGGRGRGGGPATTSPDPPPPAGGVAEPHRHHPRQLMRLVLASARVVGSFHPEVDDVLFPAKCGGGGDGSSLGRGSKEVGVKRMKVFCWAGI
jgi:hypothetical protein